MKTRPYDIRRLQRHNPNRVHGQFLANGPWNTDKYVPFDFNILLTSKRMLFVEWPNKIKPMN